MHNGDSMQQQFCCICNDAAGLMDGMRICRMLLQLNFALAEVLCCKLAKYLQQS